jgi:hypothetical protein
MKTTATSIITGLAISMEWNEPKLEDITERSWNNMPRKRKGMTAAISYEGLEGSSLIPEITAAIKSEFPNISFIVNKNALNQRGDGTHKYLIQILN